MAKPITVQIVGDAKQFNSTLADVGGKLDGFAAQFATLGGASLAAGSAIVGIGAALFQMGQSVDDAFDHLQVATGASGEALAALEQSVNSIAQTVPAGFGDIADAVALIYQRLDETGAPLDALATQLLNLSHITGTDLHENVNAVTALFNSWHIATQDQTATLDMLFRASQQTGVSVAELAASLAANKAVFDQAGYSFLDAAAFIGNMGKAGVNAQLAINGLRTAISQTSADNIQAQKAQAKAAQDSADRAVAAAERRKAAEERLADIMKSNARAAEDAAKALADATSDQADVETEAAKDVAKAKADAAKLIENVQKPVNNGAVAMAAYQKRLAEAQEAAAQKIADAEEAAAKRRRDAAKRVTDSQERAARVAEDSEDRVAKAKEQAADADERAGRRVQTSSAATSAVVAQSSQSSQDAVSGVVKRIQELGPSAEAQQLALDTFGSRAGPVLYDQLTKGKAGVDSLKDSMVNGRNTINEAEAATADFGESWQRLKNILITELEPVATAVFNGISTALENIVQYFPVGVQVIKNAFSDLWRTLSGAPGWFGDLIGGFVGNIGMPRFAAGGSMTSGGWATVGERGPESVWLPQGAQVRPAWSGGGGGGDTYNINGSNLSAAEIAREIAWQRRRGNGR